METIFLVCAVVGGTLLVCQFILGLLGLGHHDVGGHDLHVEGPQDVGHGDHPADDADHASWLAGVLTFRAVVAALTFFGLAGLAALGLGLEAGPSLAVALAAGGGALALVASLMRALARLRSDGTARVERTVGQTGTVYLSIPGHKAGAGKVTVVVQNRTMEYQALTAGDELPTGARVVVTAVISPDTVEVNPAPVPERTAT
jgi:hypothetical protein